MSKRKRPALVRTLIGPGWDGTDVEIRFVDPSVLVQLEPGVWSADGQGDPPRTLQRDNAKTHATEVQARATLARAREYRPFVQATLERLHTEQLETHTGPEAVTRVVGGKR